jgi:hypothetical protein
MSLETLKKEEGFMESILTSIKKMLGIIEEYEQFDADLIMHINSVFMILNQIGVGPSRGFSIKGEDEVWTDFIPDDSRLELVKSYMHLKVKLIFDPPLGSAVIEAMNRMISEFEWRLSVAVDPGDSKGEEENSK